MEQLLEHKKCTILVNMSGIETNRPESPASPKTRKFNIASLARQLMDQKKQDEKKLLENR